MRSVTFQGQQSTLLSATITDAVTGATSTPVTGLSGMRLLLVHFNFDYGSGGTTATFYVQTSVDGGSTWVDIVARRFTTSDVRSIMNLSALTPITAYAPTDGTLTVDTLKDGILGDRLRVKYTTTGTYAGSTTIVVTGIMR